MAKKHPKDPKSWRIKRSRNGKEHINSCSSGYHTAGQDYCQIHHVLPVTTLAQATIDKEMANDAATVKVIKNCLKSTTWNINAAPNCVGLPLKPAYHSASAPNNWDGWPSHQVDHPRYTDEVSTYLKENIWNTLAEKAEECDDYSKSVRGELNTGSTFWRGKLQERATRPIGPKGGTRYCWDHRADAGMEDCWFEPFSMADKPVKRSPPPDPATFSGTMAEYMKKIFKALK